MLTLCVSMIALGALVVLLIPRSIKTWLWCLLWGAALLILLNKPLAMYIISALLITGIREARLVVETLLIGAALAALCLYVSHLAAQLRKVTETILVSITSRELAPRKVSLVMPAFNEEENIESLTDRIVKVVRRLDVESEVILVDDGSTDRTGQICDRLAERHGIVRCIHHPVNMGKTKAFETGVLNATGDVVVLMETDWQYAPTDLVNLLTPFSEGYDVVNGWRIRRRDRLHRILMSKAYNFMLRRLFASNLQDHNSGYKVFKREIALSIYDRINKLKLYGPHRFFLVIAESMGYRVAEIPVRHFPRTRGTSYISPIKTPLKVLHDMIKVRYALSYRSDLLSRPD